METEINSVVLQKRNIGGVDNFFFIHGVGFNTGILIRVSRLKPVVRAFV